MLNFRNANGAITTKNPFSQIKILFWQNQNAIYLTSPCDQLRLRIQEHVFGHRIVHEKHDLRFLLIKWECRVLRGENLFSEHESRHETTFSGAASKQFLPI